MRHSDVGGEGYSSKPQGSFPAFAWYLGSGICDHMVSLRLGFKLFLAKVSAMPKIVDKMLRYDANSRQG